MTRWVLLTYRLPREPSTPRIALWRQLRRLGVTQLGDGVVALPLDARTREQLEWLAELVEEQGGEAAIWIAESATRAQERSIAQRMSDAVSAEYEQVIADAAATTMSATRDAALPRGCGASSEGSGRATISRRPHGLARGPLWPC